MLDCLWHLRGSVSLDGVGSNETVLDRVEWLLDRQRKTDRERGQDSIVFEDPLWSDPFGPNWKAMVIYDRGRFWIEQGLDGRKLRYDLRSLHGFLFCLFAVTAVFFFALATAGPVVGAQLAVGFFAWLYGMNVLLALAPVPLAIRKTVRGS